MTPALLVPSLALKYLLVVSAPWFAGAAAVGFLSGRQSAENATRRAREARQEAAVARLLAQNQALAARLEGLQAEARSQADVTQDAATGPAPPPGKPDSTKTSFLKRILQANLDLRDSSPDTSQEPLNNG